MAINVGERAVIATLQSAVSVFVANLATFVPDIYGQETTEHQAEITQWWQNSANNLTIRMGYVSAPVQGLSWNVVVGSSPEVSGRRVIGTYASTSGGTITDGTTFSSSYHIGCLGVNQNWLLWSQMLCKWALLYQRKTLEQEYGLFDQSISMTPLQPVPDDLKDAVAFAFMRGVSLSAQHFDTWSQLPVATITSATVGITPTFASVTVGG